MTDIVGFSGTTATIRHEGHTYSLDMTALGHPSVIGTPDALVWQSPLLTSSDGGPAIRVYWPIFGGADAQRLAVHCLVALGLAADLGAATTLVTQALQTHNPPYQVRLDPNNP